MIQGYFIEWNGDCWQSVFPEMQAGLSQLHITIEDAEQYMRSCAGNVSIKLVQPIILKGRPV